MLVESTDLLTTANAAWTLGLPMPAFQALLRDGRLAPFVTIDGLAFYHRAEVLALRRHREAMDGRPPSRPLPRTHDLF